MEEQNEFQDFDSLNEQTEEQIQVILLFGGTILITKIAEVISELGEPDCRLNRPYKIINSGTEMVPWMEQYTDNEEFMISSDKILTIVEPNNKLLEKYLEITK
jgi:hypothetical protein